MEQQTKVELKDCPFCGADGETIDPYGWLDGEGKHGPQCQECGATAESSEKWNQRPLDPSMGGERNAITRLIGRAGLASNVIASYIRIHGDFGTFDNIKASDHLRRLDEAIADAKRAQPQPKTKGEEPPAQAVDTPAAELSSDSLNRRSVPRSEQDVNG